MSSIRFIGVPPSDLAGTEICEQWVGIEIPLATDEELRRNPIAGKIGGKNDGGFVVLRSKAIEALELAGRWKAACFLGRAASRNVP